MSTTLLSRAAVVFAVAVAACHAAAQPIRLLIVDGQNNHDWPRATRILKGILEGSGQFTVGVSTSPGADSPKTAWDKWRPEFAQYGVVLSNYNGTAWPTAVEKALEIM